MTIDEKIRQLQRGTRRTPIRERGVLSPVSHRGEPVGREPLLDALLSYLEPVADGELPDNGYVWGPMGSGKSAVCTALFHRLGTDADSAYPSMSTRSTQQFCYVDTRHGGTTFELYRTILDELVDDPVPRGGVRTEQLLARIKEALSPPGRRLVVAVDHVGEPETVSVSTLAGMFEPVESSVAWLAIGRKPPTTIDSVSLRHCCHVPPYRQQAIVEVIQSRANVGLDEGAVTNEQRRTVADWADGNAHHALGALCVGAGHAVDRGHAGICDEDLVDGMLAIPQQSVSTGRLLGLAPNRKRVLRALGSIDEPDRESVATAGETIAAAVDLSTATIERFLYEFANAGIIERVPTTETAGSVGRRPSRLRLRFSPALFEQLSEQSL